MASRAGAKITAGFLACIPATSTVVLILVALMPTDYLRSGVMAYLVALSCVFYWSVYRPDLMPAWVAFAIGMFSDVVSGGPLGLGALVMLLVHWTTVGQRRALIGKAFPIAWLGFLLISAAACAFYWLIASIYFTTLLAPQPIVGAYVVGILIYPVAAFLLWRLHLVVGGG
jgi:rod shape-determining protein MreD